ncbi:hypothetical protein ACFL08_04540 [Patescibacteria group bacterium]
MNFFVRMDRFIWSYVGILSDFIERKTGFNRFFIADFLGLVFAFSSLLRMMSGKDGASVLGALVPLIVFFYTRTSVGELSKFYEKPISSVSNDELFRVGKILNSIITYRVWGWIMFIFTMVTVILLKHLSISSNSPDFIGGFSLWLCFYFASSREPGYISGDIDGWIEMKRKSR